MPIRAGHAASAYPGRRDPASGDSSCSDSASYLRYLAHRPAGHRRLPSAVDAGLLTNQGSLRPVLAIGFAAKESADVDDPHDHSVAVAIARCEVAGRRKRSPSIHLERASRAMSRAWVGSGSGPAFMLARV